MGDATGREFAIAAWGSTAEIHEAADWEPTELQRGYNVVNELKDELLYYTMDEHGGHQLESFAHTNDGGAGGLVEVDGELYIIGVAK